MASVAQLDSKLFCLDNHRLQCFLSNEEFFDSALCRSEDSLRFVGNPASAVLISTLFNNRPNMYACTANVVRGARARNNPELLLKGIEECQLPPSLGGPHLITDKNVITYKLAAAVYNNTDLPEHPIWQKLSWIRCLNKYYLHKLLGLVVDPRFYIGLHKPNSLSKLNSYLGLDPTNVAKVLNNEELSEKQQRCKLVIDTWYTAGKAQTARRTFSEYGHLIETENDVFGTKPEDFLYRHWWHKTSFGDCPCEVTAVLRVSQRVLNLIKHLWMEWLYPDVEEWKFRPDRFLNFKSEVETFLEAVSR